MNQIRKILIVDDEPTFCRQLKTFFKRNGYETRTAPNGTAALEDARKDPPDVLVIDWILKNTINGMDVVLEMRRDNPRLAAVLISGYPSPEMETRAGDLGRLTFVSKPFDAEEILSAVHRAVEGNDS